MSTLPERWVARYTRGLPDETRVARCDEIASDVFEQHVSNGASTRGLRMSIAGRTLRGVPGDLMWRFEEGRAMKEHRGESSTRPTGIRAAWESATQSWFTPLAVLVGVFNVLMAVYVIVDENGKMPGQAIGPVLLCLFAVAMFTGLWLRWRAQFDGDVAPAFTGSPARRSAIVLCVLALVAVVLIAFGLMGSIVALAAGVLTLVAISIVAARRRGQAMPLEATSELRTPPSSQSVVLADALIIVATLPALGLFWMVIPTILAIVVIGGVIGTGRGARRAATA
ncbi:MAG: hypothetical protein WD271_13410 [Acidimicrobiia bacterium]